MEINEMVQLLKDVYRYELNLKMIKCIINFNNPHLCNFLHVFVNVQTLPNYITAVNKCECSNITICRIKSVQNQLKWLMIPFYFVIVVFNLS